eukprot:scaffold227074_cov32-Prasinocladus_malaysianus.AAC.1
MVNSTTLGTLRWAADCITWLPKSIQVPGWIITRGCVPSATTARRSSPTAPAPVITSGSSKTCRCYRAPAPH